MMDQEPENFRSMAELVNCPSPLWITGSFLASLQVHMTTKFLVNVLHNVLVVLP